MTDQPSVRRLSGLAGESPSRAHVPALDERYADSGQHAHRWMAAHGVWSCDVEAEEWWATQWAGALVLGWIVNEVPTGTGPVYRMDGPAREWPVREFAEAVAHDVPYITTGTVPKVVPLGVIVHRDVPLGYHADKRMPAGTRWNATLLSSRACSGGALVLLDDGCAFTPERGTLVIYDGQHLHGVEPLALDDDDAGYRLAVTVWLGAA